MAMARCERCGTEGRDRAARYCSACGALLPREVTTGTVLELGWGRVVVGDPVGRGGMGVVRRGWLYYDPHGPRAGTPEHPVAVKLLNPALGGKPRARELFLREATALRRLRHPNVVEFHALVDHAGQLAIVMEMVAGESLGELLGRHAPRARAERTPCLALPRAWHYFSQLLGALAAIHQLGIVHRDVKPGNVLVRGDGVVKLTDFGIVRLPSQATPHTTGLAPGTGAYMSPEQVMAHELDARADLYSAGIVLYEMLTGVTPFEAPGRAELQVRAAQLEEAPVPAGARVRGLPREVDRVLARALAKSPAQRYPDALAFGEDLRAALGLPETPGWTALASLAREARGISGLAVPVVSAPPDASPVEPTLDDARQGVGRTADDAPEVGVRTVDDPEGAAAGAASGAPPAAAGATGPARAFDGGTAPLEPPVPTPPLGTVETSLAARAQRWRTLVLEAYREPRAEGPSDPAR